MKKNNLVLIFLLICTNVFSQYKFDKVLYGVAYYYKYIPYERLEKDLQMMKDCGITMVRIVLQKLIADVVKDAGLWTADQQLTFPLVVKNGVNQYGKNIHYYFNYSNERHSLIYPYKSCIDLLTGKNIEKNEKIALDAWDFVVLEEK